MEGNYCIGKIASTTQIPFLVVLLKNNEMNTKQNKHGVLGPKYSHFSYLNICNNKHSWGIGTEYPKWKWYGHHHNDKLNQGNNNRQRAAPNNRMKTHPPCACCVLQNTSLSNKDGVVLGKPLYFGATLLTYVRGHYTTL